MNHRHSRGIPTTAANASASSDGQSAVENDFHSTADMDATSDASRHRGSVRKRKQRDTTPDPLQVLPDSLVSLVPQSAKPLSILPPPQQFSELTHFPKLAPNTPNYPLCSGSVGVHLINQDLWRLFYSSQTEMILTKSGRRMFPILEFQPFGLGPGKLYNVYIDMPAVSKYTWKFQDCAWIATGERKSDKGNLIDNVCILPESPVTGQFLMKHGILFDKLKLTNNSYSCRLTDQIYLVSMHLYQPRLNITEVNNSNPNEHLAFAFPETQFIAITAYNNTIMTQLKIEHNKFAKGFRDSAGADLPMGFRTIERLKNTIEQRRLPERKSAERRHSERRHIEKKQSDRRFAEFRDATSVSCANQIFGRGQVNPDAVQTPEMKKIIELIQQREMEDERMVVQSMTSGDTAAYHDSNTTNKHSEAPINVSSSPEDTLTIPQTSMEVIDVDHSSQSQRRSLSEEPSTSAAVPLYNRLFLEAQDSGDTQAILEDKQTVETNKRDGTDVIHSDGNNEGSNNETVNENPADESDDQQTIIIRDNEAGQWVVKMEQD